jgi:hypothetical protein
VPFTDDPLTPGVTTVKAQHITELRARINARRTHFGLSAYQWVDPTVAAQTTEIRAQHILDLRTALNQAYDAARRTSPNYTDLTVGGPIRAVHITELRNGVIALE